MKKAVLSFFVIMLVVSLSSAFVSKWNYPLANAGSDSFMMGYDRMLYGASAAIYNLPGVNLVGIDHDEYLEIVIGSDEMCNPEDPLDSSNGVWRCLDAYGNLEWAVGTRTDESRSSVAIHDFYDGDGFPDIIGGTTSGWNVEAMDRFGDFQWTYPAPPVTGGPFAWHSSPAVADLVPHVTGLEIVIGCNAGDEFAENHWGMWCFQADPSDGINDGITDPGWSDYPLPPGGTDGTEWDVLWFYQTDGPVISTPCVVDMNDDGYLDVVFGTGWQGGMWGMGDEGGEIICLDGRDGTLLWSYMTGGTYPAVSGSPSAADFDGDGDFEIIVGAYDGAVYFIDGDEDSDGSISGTEISIYSHSGRVFSSPAIGDVDGDGDYEVVIGLGDGYFKCFSYNPSAGSHSLEWSVDLGDSIISSPAIVGDPDDATPWQFFKHNIQRTGFYPHTGDVLQIFIGAIGGTGAKLYQITGDGVVYDEVDIGQYVYASPIVADLDADCFLDVVITGANNTISEEIPGPDTIFCYGSDVEIHGCATEVFLPHVTDIFAVGCSLIYATVCVYNEDSGFVHGLNITNFGFLENGIPIVPPRLQILNECPLETTAVDIVLLFDYSTSMDDEVIMLGANVPEFIMALAGIDYRIAIVVFNGCPEEFDGIWRIVYTDFDGDCSGMFTGPDHWATDYIEFECLFDATLDEFTWTPRGSGYEDQYGAMVNANEMLTFRPDAKKAFVLFTDERPIVGTSCSPQWGEIAGFWEEYTPDSIINYCIENDIIAIPVTPHDGEFEWWVGGETDIREDYEGYYELGTETGGDWFNLYSEDYGSLATAIGLEIADDSCCYQFVWRETLFCVDTINLEVNVFNTEGVFGVDDTVYDALCGPRLVLTIPEPCEGITSCSGLGFSYSLVNPEDSDLNPSTAVVIVNDDTITATDPRLTVTGNTITFSPSDFWAHGDTVTFWVDYVENMNECTGSTGPCWFVVDIIPPEVLDITPANNETLTVIGDVIVSARLFDDFSGVDTSLFSSENVFIMRGSDTLSYDSLHFDDSLRFVLDGVAFPGDGHYTVCVRDLYDSPDYNYCPPNNMASFCWDFWVISVERLIWFGDTCAVPCDSAYIPLYVDSIYGALFFSLDVWFEVDMNVLEPVGLWLDSVIAPLADGQLEYVDSLEMWHIYIEWTDSVSEIDGGIIVWLISETNCNASGGDFTPIIIDSAAANSGYPRMLWGNGFFYALFRLQPWLRDIFFDRVGDTIYHALSIGANTSATKGWDSEYDVLYIEPPPSDIDVFITLNDTLYPSMQKLQRSLQGFDLPDVWVIKSDNDTLLYVHWSTAYFPEGYIELNGVLDMKRDSFYYWNVTERESLVIRWYIPTLAQDDVSLVPGWNLISFPYVPIDHTGYEVFPGIIAMYGYNADTRSYYSVEGPEPGAGYWILSLIDTVYTMVGTPVDRFSRLVWQGWNLLGATRTPEPAESLTTEPVGLLMPDKWIYNVGIGAYDYLGDPIDPGVGYWAFALGSGVASLPNAGVFRIASPIPEWMASLELNTEERTQVLTFGFAQTASENIDRADKVFPPEPPDAVQTRFVSFQRDIYDLEQDISPGLDWWLALDSKSSVRFTIPENVRLLLVTEENAMFELDGGRELTLEPGMYRICSPEVAHVPTLALLPNYPNPFNASTIVGFTLPERQKVVISVHDVMGRKLGILLNDEIEPGYHKIRWDTDNAASGIYFIRLSTITGSRTRRVMLVK